MDGLDILNSFFYLMITVISQIQVHDYLIKHFASGDCAYGCVPVFHLEVAGMLISNLAEDLMNYLYKLLSLAIGM